MKISGDASDHAVLRELGGRIARHRLNRNLTQATLAAEAGVSTPTVQRVEGGMSAQASNLVRILRALGLLDNLETLIPEPAASPIQRVKMQGRLRRRASSPSKRDGRASEWTWGDGQ